MAKYSFRSAMIKAAKNDLKQTFQVKELDAKTGKLKTSSSFQINGMAAAIALTLPQVKKAIQTDPEQDEFRVKAAGNKISDVLVGSTITTVVDASDLCAALDNLHGIGAEVEPAQEPAKKEEPKTAAEERAKQPPATATSGNGQPVKK